MSDDEPVAEAEVETPEVEAEAETPEVETEAISEDAETETEEAAAPAEEAEPGESSPPKKKDAMQERFNDLTREIYGLKEDLAAAKQATAKPPPDPDKTLADFDYDEAAFKAHEREVAKAAAQAEVQAQAQQAAALNRASDFESREKEFLKQHDDYYQIAHYAPIAPHVADLLVGTEKGPELAYYLGNNPEVAVSISRLGIIDAARELGVIEGSRLVKPAPSISQTPPPPTKLKPRDAKVEPKLTDPMTQAQFEKRRKKVISSR